MTSLLLFLPPPDISMEDKGTQETTEVQPFDHTSAHTPVHRVQQHPVEESGDDSQVYCLTCVQQYV